MTVGILIISHNRIGSELMATTQQMLSSSPLSVDVLSISIDADLDLIKTSMLEKVDNLDQGNGLLILTDMFGSTPSNIACILSDRDDIRIVSGLNLPMLIRLLNYPKLSLDELEEKAISGGQEGIARCSSTGCIS